MKYTKTIFSLLIFLALLCGCTPQSQSLSEVFCDEINTAWGEEREIRYGAFDFDHDYYGTYDGYTVLIVRTKERLQSQDFLGDGIILYPRAVEFYAYKDGEFFPLEALLEQKKISNSALNKIARIHKEKYPLLYGEAPPELLPLTPEQIAEIEEEYFEETGYPLSVEGNYYGTYKGFIIVYQDWNIAETQEITVAGEHFCLNGNVWAYKNGTFSKLQEAYQNGLLSKEDVAAISYYHELINGY